MNLFRLGEDQLFLDDLGAFLGVRLPSAIDCKVAHEHDAWLRASVGTPISGIMTARKTDNAHR